MNNMNNNVNSSIKCSVDSCTYHAQNQNYCTKSEINVGCCNTTNPTTPDCTECASFKMNNAQ